MVLRVWNTSDPDFRARFDSLLDRMSLSDGLVAAGTADREPPQVAV